MDNALLPGQVNCPICENRGYLLVTEPDGTLYSRPCKCMELRRTVRLIERSGLSDLFERYTLKNYQTPDEWTKHALEKAVDYCRNGRGSWFYISGKPGTGKTHLCTGICRYLLRKGDGVRYMVWREDAPRLKALINDAEAYREAMLELIRVPVLYIDDFFKGSVTEADRNLAFALLNARYNDSHRRTILSSELSLTAVRREDPAISSRIMEKARGYVLEAPSAQPNWREKEC
jgi:DNA replication protein DnaC